MVTTALASSRIVGGYSANSSPKTRYTSSRDEKGRFRTRLASAGWSVPLRNHSARRRSQTTASIDSTSEIARISK